MQTIKTPALIKTEKGYLPIALYDEIELETLNEYKIQLEKLEGYKINTNRNHLAYQITEKLREIKGGKIGLSIRIKKKTPPQIGLSSSLSSAAGVLLFLNEEWDLNLGEEEVKSLCNQVSPELWEVVESVKGNPKNPKNVVLIKAKHILGNQELSTQKRLQHFPDLKEILKELKRIGATEAGISQKGSSVYAFFKSPIDPKLISTEIKSKIDFIWVGKTC